MNWLFLQVFCAIFSGAIQSLAISNELLPFGSSFLALICLSPLYLAAYDAKSYKQSFWLFFIHALTVHLFSSYWLANFHGFAIFTLGASAIGTAFQAGFCGIIFYVFPRKLHLKANLEEQAGNKPQIIMQRIIWFTLFWIFYEYIKSNGALGYPWGTISMAAYNLKILTQIADITGVWGITFICVLFSCTFAEGIKLQRFFVSKAEEKKLANQYLQVLKSVVIILGIVVIYGIVQLIAPREIIKEFNTVIVQQNIDPWLSKDKKSIEISKKLTEEGIEQLAKQNKIPDLVIWSEGVLSKSFPKARNYYSSYPQDESLTNFIARIGSPFLIGGSVTIDEYKRQNANGAILFDKNGIYSGFYNKIHLVPFAEKIPYADNPLMSLFMTKIVGFQTTLTSGFQYVLFKIPLNSNGKLSTPMNYNRPLYENINLNVDGYSNKKERQKFYINEQENPLKFVNFTTPICFEDSFPSVCSKLYNMGSEIFVNITNDSWSKTKSAEFQHFIASSYRAIEFRTTLLRCTNSGYSAIVGPTGTILDSLPLFKECSLGTTIPIYKHQRTVYSVFGDWFAYFAIAFIAIYIILEYLKDKKDFFAKILKDLNEYFNSIKIN